MNTVVREIASLVIGLAGVVMLGIGLNQVLDIGSCVSGGSYAVTRPCPEGTDSLFWLSFAGAILWIAGILTSRHFFFAPGAGQVVWVAGFAGGGVAMLVKVLTQPSMPPDAKLGASIVAAVFIPIGLVVAVTGIVQLVRKRGGARPPTGDPRKPGRPRGPNAWTRFKTLNDLRSTGALTREEFETLRVELADPAQDDPHTQRTDRIALIRQLSEQRTSGALSTAEFESRKRKVLRG